MSTPAWADEPVPTWPSHRNIADWTSTGLVGAQIGLDTLHSFKSPEKGKAFLNQGCRLGLATGLSEIGKYFIHRQRPDGSDLKSWPSEHTALLDASRGWSFGIGWGVTIGGGYLRSAANRHYLSDVLSGIGVGELAQFICKGVGN